VVWGGYAGGEGEGTLREKRGVYGKRCWVREGVLFRRQASGALVGRRTVRRIVEEQLSVGEQRRVCVFGAFGGSGRDGGERRETRKGRALSQAATAVGVPAAASRRRRPILARVWCFFPSSKPPPSLTPNKMQRERERERERDASHRANRGPAPVSLIRGAAAACLAHHRRRRRPRHHRPPPPHHPRARAPPPRARPRAPACPSADPAAALAQPRRPAAP
jgi:hypothetical protein